MQTPFALSLLALLPVSYAFAVDIPVTTDSTWLPGEISGDAFMTSPVHSGAFDAATSYPGFDFNLNWYLQAYGYETVETFSLDGMIIAGGTRYASLEIGACDLGIYEGGRYGTLVAVGKTLSTTENVGFSYIQSGTGLKKSYTGSLAEFTFESKENPTGFTLDADTTYTFLFLYAGETSTRSPSGVLMLDENQTYQNGVRSLSPYQWYSPLISVKGAKQLEVIDPNPVIPEPSTTALLLGGLSLAGAVLRRRRV